MVGLGNLLRLRTEVRVGHTEVELGEVEVIPKLRLGDGDIEVGEPQLGIAAEASAAGQLININDAEPPRATI